MSLAEIKNAIRDLEPEEKVQLIDWLQTEELIVLDEATIAAIKEGIASSENEPTIPLEDVRQRIAQWTTQ